MSRQEWMDRLVDRGLGMVLGSPEAPDVVSRVLAAHAARRSRRRLGLLIFPPIVAAAALLLLWVSAGPAAAFHVEAVQGEARVAVGAGTRPVEPGTALKPAAVLRVLGTSVTFSSEDGSRIVAEGDAEVRTDSSRSLYVTRGRVVCDVAKAAGGSFVVVTPHATATVLGTRFTLAVEPDHARLEVERGLVALGRPGEAPVRVAAGQAAEAGADLAPRVVDLSVNLLQDPGFEASSTPWMRRPLDGRLLPDLLWDKAVVRSGRRSVRIEPGELYYQDVPVQAGRKYRISAWVKAPRFSGDRTLWMEAKWLRSPFPTHDDRAAVPSAADGWQRLVIEAVAPEGAKTLRCVLGANTPETGWADDCACEEIAGEETP